MEKEQMYTDKLIRQAFCRYVDFIVTFSSDDRIFGRPTIRISNGIDFARIPLRSPRHGTSKELHLIGVAEIHFWHGFDRLLKGLGAYYGNNPEYKVYFHLIGKPSGRREEKDIATLIRRYCLQPFVTLYGAKHGEELDALCGRALLPCRLCLRQSGTASLRHIQHQDPEKQGICGARVRLRLLRNGR